MAKSSLSKHSKSPSGCPGGDWRTEVSSVEEVDHFEDAVKVAVLDVEAEVGDAALCAHVVRHNCMPRRILLEVDNVSYI